MLTKVHYVRKITRKFVVFCRTTVDNENCRAELKQHVEMSEIICMY